MACKEMREGGGSCADDVVAQHVVPRPPSISGKHPRRTRAAEPRFVSEYTRYRVRVAVYGIKVTMDNKIEGDAEVANRILL
jgi:hypothetical protein